MSDSSPPPPPPPGGQGGGRPADGQPQPAAAQPSSPPPPPPPQQQPAQPPPGAPGGAVAPLGPPGTARSTGLVILVSILTLGIWTWVWSYQNGEELKRHNGTGLGGVLYLLFTFLLYPVTMFLIASEIEEMYNRAGKNSPVSALTGLWFLLPIIGNIIWYIKVQAALNDHWVSLGAPPPSGL